MKKRTALIVCVAVILLMLVVWAVWAVWANKALECNTFTISDNRIPDAFDGYRIAHVSDLHNVQIGKDNEKLLTMLRDAKPDMIAITGDLIDSRNTDIALALRFAEKAMEIAPCYYVTGNHEARIDAYDTLKAGLVELGVVVLEDASVELIRNNEKILLLGVDDPSFRTDYLFGDAQDVMRSKLQQLPCGEAFTVLLSHRPELFDVYVENEVDLVLSGHAHGGQFRLPFFGAVIAPNQGFFPEYDAGLYAEQNTKMIVSRGIGSTILPLRFNNRPEVVLVELRKIA